jgi:hypothetical protein
MQADEQLNRLVCQSASLMRLENEYPNFVVVCQKAGAGNLVPEHNEIPKPIRPFLHKPNVIPKTGHLLMRDVDLRVTLCQQPVKDFRPVLAVVDVREGYARTQRR